MITNKWSGEHFDADFIFPLGGHNQADYEYHSLLIKILQDGLWKQNRTGTKTLSIFGPQVEFKNVGQVFPLLTTKKVHMKSIIGELLWFLSGSTNKHELKEKYGVSIWDEWGDDETGELGPIYGHQWVNWTYYEENMDWTPDGKPRIYDTPKNNKDKYVRGYTNQLRDIIWTLQNNPDDRRMIVSAWNVPEIPKMALPPCHWSYQFYSVLYPGDGQRTLHIIENQRSVDTGLGLPFNIASYALLLMMIAQQVDMIPGNLIMNLGDAHIYEDHVEQLIEQLSRNSRGSIPKITIDKQKDLWSYKPEHFHLDGYSPHPTIKMPVSV
jgi:thymidylate synthase